MTKLDVSRWSALIVVLVCLAGGALPVEAVCCPSVAGCTTTTNPSTCTVTAPPTACLNSIMKGFFPSYQNPTSTVYIFKYLAANQNCDLAAPAMSAFCNPGSNQNVSRVDASALGAQITMNPSCSWNCAGACGSISTNAASDGLPVELMDFGVNEEGMSEGTDDTGKEGQ